MRNLILALAAASLLAACDGLIKEPSRGSERSDINDRIEADIVVGRVEVMQDQTQAGLRLLGMGVRETAAPAARDAFVRLRGTVLRFNVLRDAACAVGVPGNLCAQAPYFPAWYAAPAGPLSGAGLRRMAEEMQDHMMPFWTAVCDKAKAKTGDQHFCAIE